MACCSGSKDNNYSTRLTPLGIKRLKALDRVTVNQKETYFKGNRYVILGPDGKPILYAKEHNGTIGVIFGGNNRSFHMDLYDTQNNMVISFRRPFTFGPDKLEVSVCGVVASVVRQQQTFFTHVLLINSASDQPRLKVKGSGYTTGACDFKIYTMDKKQIGVITKKWGGMLKEMFSHADDFDISFPRDLDVRYKAAILGACLLIDFLCYEKK